MSRSKFTPIKEQIGLSPLLQADPATLPAFRKGTRQKFGGMLAYIYAVKPGIPPLGWRDITPYFGGIPKSLAGHRRLAESKGYLLAIQTITENGFRYRRVAVALAVSPSVITKRNKDQK